MKALSKDRALQIINNVHEEFNDHGQTNFATKKELCETIQWLSNEQLRVLQDKDTALDRIFTIAAKARLYS